MKRALITGGTRGIGLACVKRFSEAGYLVTALYSRGEEDAKEAKRLCPAAEFVRADVAKEREVAAVFETLPSLDVLVNNAGVSLFAQVQDTSWEQWERVMAVNAGGAFLCTKYAVKKMLRGGEGAIVNVSSVWGETGGSCESAYSASKGAVIAFTKALAKELAPSHIMVNCVSPGAIDTQMNERLSEEERKALESEIPLGRFGKAGEVAELIYQITLQKYLTGQDIALNGGYWM